MIYCHCVAIYLLLEHNTFLWQIILCLALFREKTLWESHKQHILHLDHWEQRPGRSVLGMVLDMNTGHYFNACSASSSISTHIVTHLHIYSMHIKPIHSVSNLCKPISGLCVEWFQMGVAGNGEGSHQCLQRILFCGVLLRFKTERQFNPLNFQPSDSRSILLSLLHECFETCENSTEHSNICYDKKLNCLLSYPIPSYCSYGYLVY